MTRRRESDIDRWRREAAEQEARRVAADERDPEAVMHIEALKNITDAPDTNELRNALLFVIERVRL